MTQRFKTVASVTVGLVMTALLTTAGCGDGDLEKAQQDAREAKATVKKLELSLDRAMREITDLKNELGVVRETRDELQKQVDQLSQERDKASALAQQAEQVITHLSTRAEGQVGTTTALRKQIEDLKAVVADQQALIEELQKGGAIEPIPAAEPEALDAVDPNAPEGGPDL
jgi:chromosome segregation ATPase